MYLPHIRERKNINQYDLMVGWWFALFHHHPPQKRKKGFDSYNTQSRYINAMNKHKDRKLGYE